jgi:hypothetical protein
MPSAAVIRKSFCFGPLNLLIKEREDFPDIAAAQGIIEPAHDFDGCGHDDLRVNEDRKDRQGRIGAVDAADPACAA